MCIYLYVWPKARNVSGLNLSADPRLGLDFRSRPSAHLTGTFCFVCLALVLGTHPLALYAAGGTEFPSVGLIGRRRDRSS